MGEDRFAAAALDLELVVLRDGGRVPGIVLHHGGDDPTAARCPRSLLVRG
jgi:hypothetical protein